MLRYCSNITYKYSIKSERDASLGKCYLMSSKCVALHSKRIPRCIPFLFQVFFHISSKMLLPTFPNKSQIHNLYHSDLMPYGKCQHHFITLCLHYKTNMELSRRFYKTNYCIKFFLAILVHCDYTVIHGRAQSLRQTSSNEPFVLNSTKALE